MPFSSILAFALATGTPAVDSISPDLDSNALQISYGKPYWNGDSVSLQFAIPSNQTDVVKTLWRVNGKTTSGAKSSLGLGKLNPGNYVVQVRLQDSSGNQGKASEVRFVVDKTSPKFEGLGKDTLRVRPAGTFSLLLPFNEAVQSKGVLCTGLPAGLSIRSKSAKVLEIYGTLKASVLEQKSTLMVSGIKDLAGNISDSIDLGEWTFDAKAPSLDRKAIRFLHGDSITNQDPVLQVSLPTDFTGMRPILCKLDQSKACQVSADTISFPGLAEGKHTLSLTLQDGAGNFSNSLQVSLNIDRTPPALLFESLQWNQNNRTELCAKSLSLSAPSIPEIASWKWSSAGAQIEQKGNGFRLENLAEGLLQGDLQAADLAGNYSKAIPVKLRIDCTTPQIKHFTLSRPEPLSAGPVKVQIQFSEPVILEKNKTWDVQQNTPDSVILSGEIPLTPFEGTTHLTLKNVVDKAGNKIDSLSIPLNIDTKHPQILSAAFLRIDHTSGSFLFHLFFSEAMANAGSMDSASIQWRGSKKLQVLRAMPGKSTMQAIADLAGNTLIQNSASFEVPNDSVLLASQLLTNTNPKQSRALASLAVAQNPNCTACLHQLGKMNALFGDSLGEFSTLRALAVLTPEDTTLQARIVKLALAFGKPEIAKTHLQSLLISKGTRIGISDDSYSHAKRPYWTWNSPQLDSNGIHNLPDAARVFVQDGYTLALQGKYNEAQDRYRTAQTLAPAEWIRIQIALLHLLQGKFETAATIFDSLPHRPAYAAYHSLALYQSGNTKEAMTRIQSHADSLPPGQSREIYGVLLASEGKFDLALPYLTLQNRAWLHFVKGRSAEAESLFLKLNAEAQNSVPEILFGLGLVREQQGDVHGATVQYRKALSIKPEYVDVLLQLARLQSKYAAPLSAKQSLDRALVVQPNLEEALRLQAVVHLQLGDTILARRYSAMAYAARQSNKKANAENIAVLRFQAMGLDSSLQWTTLALAENVNTELSQFSDYRIVDRNNLEKLFMEKDLSQTEDGTEGAKLLGAQNLVMGSIQTQGAMIRVDMRHVSVATGEVLATASTQGTITDLPILARTLTLNLLGLQGRVELLQGSQGQDPKVQALVAKSKTARYAGNTEQERMLASQALKLDPRALAALDAGVIVAGDSQFGKSVAVLPFFVASKQSKDSWMSKGIQEALMTDLRKIASLQLVERSQLDALMQENDLQASDLVQEKSIATFEGSLDAGIAILGSIQSVNGKLRIDARMILVDSGKVLLATSVEGRESELLILENRLAQQIADKLNIKLTDYEKQRLAQADTTAVFQMKTQFSQEMGREELEAQLVEYKESSGKLAGRIMIAASTVVTLFAGGTAFRHYQDRSDYESETNSDLASRKGDIADQSYGAMVVSVGAALAAWVATGAFYVWDYFSQSK